MASNRMSDRQRLQLDMTRPDSDLRRDILRRHVYPQPDCLTDSHQTNI
jgi:hypothetical protein